MSVSQISKQQGSAAPQEGHLIHLFVPKAGSISSKLFLTEVHLIHSEILQPLLSFPQKSSLRSASFTIRKLLQMLGLHLPDCNLAYHFLHRSVEGKAASFYLIYRQLT